MKGNAAPSARRIARVTIQDLDAVHAILEPSHLHVDLQAELGREIALPWVIRDDTGTIAAFSLAWSVADELHLLELASHPEQRRRGFARALIAALIEYARTHQKRLLLLEVRTSNHAAIALYEDTGFERTGVRRSYYADTGEDAVEMRITFDPHSGQIIPTPD